MSNSSDKRSLLVVFGSQEFGDDGRAYYLPSNHADIPSFETFAIESFQDFTRYDSMQQLLADGLRPEVFDPAAHLFPEAPVTSAPGQEWGDQSSLNVPASNEAYVTSDVTQQQLQNSSADQLYDQHSAHLFPESPATLAHGHEWRSTDAGGDQYSSDVLASRETYAAPDVTNLQLQHYHNHHDLHSASAVRRTDSPREPTVTYSAVSASQTGVATTPSSLCVWQGSTGGTNSHAMVVDTTLDDGGAMQHQHWQHQQQQWQQRNRIGNTNNGSMKA